jgi:hypothetical protein
MFPVTCWYEHSSCFGVWNSCPKFVRIFNLHHMCVCVKFSQIMTKYMCPTRLLFCIMCFLRRLYLANVFQRSQPLRNRFVSAIFQQNRCSRNVNVKWTNGLSTVALTHSLITSYSTQDSFIWFRTLKSHPLRESEHRWIKWKWSTFPYEWPCVYPPFQQSNVSNWNWKRTHYDLVFKNEVFTSICL